MINKRKSVRMGESERGTGEKAKEAVWEFKASSLRIIIPQTIRSVIRVYLLWRMRDYDSGAVVYRERGKIKKKGGRGRRKIRCLNPPLPRDVSARRKSRLSNFRTRDRNEVEERTRENDRKRECERERESV